MGAEFGVPPRTTHDAYAYKLFTDQTYTYTYRLRPLPDVHQAMKLSRPPTSTE